MSIRRSSIPAPDEVNYHEAIQEERVRRAKRLIDPGDVLAVIDSRIAAESDPSQHPMYPLVMFFLGRSPAVNGGAFYDHCKRLVLGAIDTATDDLLELED
jgi:hypothetical protein